MKKSLFLCAGIALLFLTTNSCAVKKSTVKNNEWQPLFNGTDLKDWTVKIHHYETGDNYGETFRVVDNVIQVRYDKYEGDFNNRFGHLYYNTPFSNYHLKLEYRFVGKVHPGAKKFAIKNSGVMFHSQDPKTMAKEQNWPISVEMQFIGGITKNEARPTGNMCSPGTDIRFNGSIAKKHCVQSSSKTYYGDQWVTAELIVRGDSAVTHIINGEVVLQYTKPQIATNFNILKGHTVAAPSGQLLKEGFIALQSEAQPIDFRNIEIKKLGKN